MTSWKWILKAVNYIFDRNNDTDDPDDFDDFDDFDDIDDIDDFDDFDDIDDLDDTEGLDDIDDFDDILIESGSDNVKSDVSFTGSRLSAEERARYLKDAERYASEWKHELNKSRISLNRGLNQSAVFEAQRAANAHKKYQDIMNKLK